MARNTKFGLVLIFLLFYTSSMWACICEVPTSVAVSLKHANVVFSGKVISKTITTNYDSLGVKVIGKTPKMPFDWRIMPIAVVKIKVDKLYKGKQTSTILTILTPPNGASCGYYFEIGKRYIVYATIIDDLLLNLQLKRRSFDDQTFWTNQCTRTTNWNNEEEKALLKQQK